MDVVIAGIGQTRVGEHWDISLRDLAFEALEKARLDAQGLQPDMLLVGNAYAPVISHQAQVATLVADYSGLRGIEAATIEAAGASGGAALRQGYLAVASGESDVCLVVGVEKMTDQVGSAVESASATAMDSEYEADEGISPASQAALLMRRYLHESGAPRMAFAGFPITAHANAAGNPNAMFRNKIRPEAYQQAGMVAPPLNLLDAAPAADGAAALVLARPELLPPDMPHALVRISGSSMATDTLALHARPDLLSFSAARLSIELACRQAGIVPGDVDLFELFDAYSVYAALSLEAAGFAERGQGWRLADEGAIALGGRIPVATMGGLKARGNPGGATGAYQAVEAVLQLRGQAGENQVEGAERALVQSLGGPASAAVTHVLERFEV